MSSQSAPSADTPIKGLIDSHCHLDFNLFDADRDDVLAACEVQGVSGIVVPATRQATWTKTMEVCALTQSGIELWPALGMHPLMIDDHEPHHLSELHDLAARTQPVAIGEIGLDFHKSLGFTDAQIEKQLLYFEKQLRIAHELALPIIVHNRKAHDECVALLDQFEQRGEPIAGGIIHAFSGGMHHADAYLERGFKLGFGGMVTFARSRKLHALVRHVGLDGIVLETDAPDLTPAPHQHERNSPAFLPYVAKSVASLLDKSICEVIERTTKNTYEALRL